MRKLFKSGRASWRDKAEAEAPGKMEGTVAVAEAATPLPRKPDLYSTEGSIGMKVVAEPSDAALDIVFVHGLTGNRETTWTHSNGVFWPEQLGQDINTARIMTFGYDADVIKIWGMVGGNNLRNHGKSLAFAVSDRRRDCRDRPIIFIAHSLGGLVCEQAILCCGEGDKNLEKVFRSTRGIIFMGTPHAGSDLANWGYMLANLLSTVRNTNSAILGPLRQKSDLLTAVQQQFQQLLRKPEVNIEIYCFFEEKAVVGVGVIVPEHSATLSQYPNQSIAANHMDMTRFSGMNDEGYQKVLSRVQDNIEVMEPPKTSVDDLKAHPEYEKRSKCHRIFSTPDYKRYKERNPYPVKGTCQWFLQHPNYTSWRDSDISSILWVSADPGCGKSVLSKLLVDKELQATKSRTTCYFFFKDDNEIQKTATSALCALLHQIFSQKPELLGHAVEVFDQNKEEKLKQSVDLLWQVLTTAAQDPCAGEIVCILDALDECRHVELKSLLRILNSFYDEQSNLSSNVSLKFLVTSRPLQHIEDEFSDLSRKIPAIRLAGEEHTDQILHETGLVIEFEIEKIQRDFPMNPKTVRILREEFTKVEHRTYLWLMLIFDLIRQDLQSVMTSSEREKLFYTIPTSVDTAYTAILNKSTNKDRARMLLKIVCAATQPLSVMEITTALLIREDHKTYDDLEMPPGGFSNKYIKNLCGLFVSVIDGRVFLLHQTAKEFLMAKGDCDRSAFSLPLDRIWKNSVSLQDSSLLLASICMWFLRLEEFEISLPERQDWNRPDPEHEFFEYSAKNWPVHFRTAMVPDSHPIIALGVELCNVQSGRCTSWTQIYLDTIRDQYNVYNSDKNNNLSLASVLGLVKVVSQILAAPGVDVNSEFNGRTPLWWAAYYGHEAVVGRLLAAPGINVNATDRSHETPLLLAALQGHDTVVGQLLAAPGIDIQAATKYSSPPLCLAARGGHEAVVCRLLAIPSIDVNATDEDGGSALWCAASKGHEAVVGRLLAVPGIHVNGKDKRRGWTPLWYAAYCGYDAVVGRLLAAPGIDVNTPELNLQTPLSTAAYHGHEAVVGRLLAAPSIDVSAADSDDRSPLWWAARGGKEAVVDQLLAAPGIDVNAADKKGQSPLWISANQGYKVVVSRLVAAPGINVNAINKEGLPPLWTAINQWHGGVVDQLLAAPSIDVNEGSRTPLLVAVLTDKQAIIDQLLATPGINVNAIDKGNWTALLWAAYEGKEAIVGLLLAAPGINVNTADESGQTPLWWAANRGHKEVVGRLLAVQSINVNAANNDGETPLWRAARWGHEAVVGQLLAVPGINVNTVSNKKFTPLLSATVEGYETIVGQLLAAPGIDVNAAEDEKNATPLLHAAYMGHEVIVGLLLAAPGIDMNTASKAGMTPLDYAKQKSHEGVIKLLESGALVSPKSPNQGCA